MIKELAEQLSHGNNLTIDQMINVMDKILTGTQNDEDVAEFLKNLTEKGESDDELLAMLNKMEEFALHISPNCPKTTGTGFAKIVKGKEEESGSAHPKGNALVSLTQITTSPAVGKLMVTDDSLFVPTPPISAPTTPHSKVEPSSKPSKVNTTPSVPSQYGPVMSAVKG